MGRDILAIELGVGVPGSLENKGQVRTFGFLFINN